MIQSIGSWLIRHSNAIKIGMITGLLVGNFIALNRLSGLAEEVKTIQDEHEVLTEQNDDKAAQSREFFASEVLKIKLLVCRVAQTFAQDPNVDIDLSGTDCPSIIADDNAMVSFTPPPQNQNISEPPQQPPASVGANRGGQPENPPEPPEQGYTECVGDGSLIGTPVRIVTCL